jgi:hypothetical protein
VRLHPSTAIRDPPTEKETPYEPIGGYCTGHKTRWIVSFLLAAFSFTWAFIWWLAVLAHPIV